MKVTVLGSSGMLGTDVVKVLEALGHEVKALTSKDVDLTKPATINDCKWLAKKNADWVVNCAAYTAVDQSEEEPEAPIPSDATADPTDAHTALRAVADLGVEYFLSLKADPTFKALDLQLEAGKANAWAVANRRKFTKRFFVNWLNRGLDRAAATNADANLHSAKHPKYGW